MTNSIPNQFRAALNHLLRQEGRGAQVRLSTSQDIDRGYLNAIIKGRKPGAEDIRARIATHFGMTYEEMLALGRRIQEGGAETEEGKKLEVRLPKKSAKGEEGVVEDSDNEKRNNHLGGISKRIQQVREILESGTEHSISLSTVIDTYHQSIMTDSKIEVIENRLEEIGQRLEQMEKVLASEKSVAQRSKKKTAQRIWSGNHEKWDSAFRGNIKAAEQIQFYEKRHSGTKKEQIVNCLPL